MSRVKLAGSLLAAAVLALAACDPLPEAETPPLPPPYPDPVAGVALGDRTTWIPALAARPASPALGWSSIDMYSGGVAFTDMNADDLPDLVLARSGDSDPALQGVALLLGRPDGAGGGFEDVTLGAGLADDAPVMGVAAADLDGDGLVDLVVTTHGAGDRLWRQTSPLVFEEVGEAAGIRGDGRRSRSLALLDADLDGWLDLYVSVFDGAGPNGHYGGQSSWTAPNVLYRNRGDGTFEDVTATAGVACYGRSTLGAAAGDLDADGDPDLYVANDFFDDCLYENRGDGTFDEVSLAAGVGIHAINGMGVALGDGDGDGDLDILVTDDLRADASTGNAFYWNLTEPGGGLLFESAALAVGLDGGASVEQSSAVYWGAGWRDFDGDGWLDVHIAQQLTGPDRIFVWSPAAGTFAPVPADRFAAAFDVRGSAYADYDRDGRVDLVLLSRDGPPRLFHNDGALGTAWIRVRVEGPPGNRDGLGALVTVEACGRSLLRSVDGNTGYLSFSEPVLTIGLGDCPAAGDVTVLFPGGEMRANGAPIPAGNEVRIALD